MSFEYTTNRSPYLHFCWCKKQAYKKIEINDFKGAKKIFEREMIRNEKTARVWQENSKGIKETDFQSFLLNLYNKPHVKSLLARDFSGLNEEERSVIEELEMYENLMKVPLSEKIGLSPRVEDPYLYFCWCKAEAYERIGNNDFEGARESFAKMTFNPVTSKALLLHSFELFDLENNDQLTLFILHFHEKKGVADLILGKDKERILGRIPFEKESQAILKLIQYEEELKKEIERKFTKSLPKITRVISEYEPWHSESLDKRPA